jgi:hypothetical protein
MSVLTNLTSAWKFGDGLLKVVCGVLIGFLLCLVTCGKGSHTTKYASVGQDTVWIDTSKIIIRTRPPEFVPIIITDTVDREHDCWGHVPMFAIGRDSVGIDSANSCKGIYLGWRISHMPDTVHDTLHIPFVPPEPDTVIEYKDPPLGWSASIGAGPAIGAVGVADAEIRGWIDRWMLELRPALVMLDKLYAFMSATIRYKF